MHCLQWFPPLRGAFRFAGEPRERGPLQNQRCRYSSLEQFHFEIALTAREGSAPQRGVDFGKNRVFSKMILLEIE
jgi:hypothetical protein